jgi:hypothetical protein
MESLALLHESVLARHEQRVARSLNVYRTRVSRTGRPTWCPLTLVAAWIGARRRRSRVAGAAVTG